MTQAADKLRPIIMKGVDELGLLNRVFGNKNPPKNLVVLRGINQFDTSLNTWSISCENDIAISAIHSNASNIAKLTPKHIRKNKDKYEEWTDAAIKRMLEYPNPYMNFYDFLYKVAWQREEKDNAVIYYKRDSNELYPINYTKIDILEVSDSGNIFAQFSFRTGYKVTLPFEDLIILRKHFNKNDLWGDNSKVLNNTLDVVSTTDQGIVKAIKKSATIRGWLEFSTQLKETDKQNEIDKFVNNYLTINNDGGIAATDPRYKFIESSQNQGYVPNKALVDFSKERIYSFYGTNENIVQSKFTEDQWNAYYENTIEPVAVQLSLEFSKKIFSDRAMGHGNEIVFESNRLQYASNGTKVAVARLLTDIGAASLDQILEIFNMAPIGGDDGKRRVQTLNMVNAIKADQYQVGGDTGGQGQNTQGDEGSTTT